MPAGRVRLGRLTSAGVGTTVALRQRTLQQPKLSFGWLLYSTTSRPIWPAVPAMISKSASSLREFRSFAFVFTMSMICLRVTLPTFVLFGSFEPAAMPATILQDDTASSLNAGCGA